MLWLRFLKNFSKLLVDILNGPAGCLQLVHIKRSSGVERYVVLVCYYSVILLAPCTEGTEGALSRVCVFVRVLHFRT
jgi:hypothetical protein